MLVRRHTFLFPKTEISWRLSPHGRAVVWMLVGCTCLGIVNVAIRAVTQKMPVFEVVFFRNLTQFFLFLPLLGMRGLAMVRTTHIRAHLARSVSGLAVMLFWFSALSMMPVAEATALSFTAPLFALIGAAVFLGERVGGARWIATATGFVGVLIITRPGLQVFGLAHGLALASSVFMATSALMVKRMTRSDSPGVIVFYMGLFMSALSLPFALAVWQTPDPLVLGDVFVIGILGTAGQLALGRAFSGAEASSLVGLDFVRLPVAALAAYLMFSETPDIWTWIGGLLIFAAAMGSPRRRRRETTPSVEVEMKAG